MYLLPRHCLIPCVENWPAAMLLFHPVPNKLSLP